MPFTTYSAFLREIFFKKNALVGPFSETHVLRKYYNAFVFNE